MIEPGGPPSSWVAWGGRYAPCLTTGMPSYEHETVKGMVVFDLLLAQHGAAGELLYFSRWYGTACILAPGGPVPLYHDPDALWVWRPCLYETKWLGKVQQRGSQQELEWRHGLSMVMHHIHADAPMDLDGPTERARELLLENLSPQQRLEYLARDKFRVRGFSGKMYEVCIGAGFNLISERTCDQWVSFCLHPEDWMPHEDVALATLLMLQDEELEQEAIGNAGAVFLPVGRGSTDGDRVAFRLERDLIPRPTASAT